VLAYPIQVAGRGVRAVATMATAPSLVSCLAPGQFMPFQKLKIHHVIAPTFHQRRSAVTAFANAIVKSSRNYTPGAAPLQNVVRLDTNDLWKPRIVIQPCQGVRYENGRFRNLLNDAVEDLHIAAETSTVASLEFYSKI
jgi:hypothetical protein